MADTKVKDAIAIVGMACRFAGSSSVRDYWLRILSGESAFSDNDDPDARHFLAGDPSEFGHLVSLRGGYLKELWHVNPAAIDSTAAISGTNPEIALVSDLVMQILKGSDFNLKSVQRDRIGLLLGYSPEINNAMVNWVQLGIGVDQMLELMRKAFPHGSTEQFETLRKSLVSALPSYDSRNITGILNRSILPVITRHFDIKGPSFCINNGSQSSSIALQTGCDSLLSGRADIVITGGVQGVVSPQYMMPFSRLGILSKSPESHPYGRNADGMIFGEGAGLVVLKRLEDAIRDQDRIFAIVRSVSATSEGNTPRNGESLISSYRTACSKAGIPVSTIKLIEGEGSAFPQQDRDEIRALSTVYSGGDKLAPGTVAIGSAKALIGHTEAAAGIAGVIKVALSLYHRVIPPSQEADRPGEQLKLHDTPFYLNLSPRPWVHNDQGFPRRAAVSTMSYDGLSSCIILEQFRDTP